MTGKNERKRKADDLGESVVTAPTQKKQCSEEKNVEDSSNDSKKPIPASKEHIPPKSGFETVDQLDQRYVLVPSKLRDAYLTELLVNHFEGKTPIIFTGKCRNAERLRIVLREPGLRSTALHSQMPQNDRMGSLAKFKSGIVPILIATYVRGRSLDIPTVQVVINYELPADPTDCIHRVGRTARAGRGGLALSLVTQSDIEIFKNVEAKIQQTMPEYPVAESDAFDYPNQVSPANRTASMRTLLL
ncbi:P-loop containing nucleoside triphosphate hydrolase protein [Cladochytrium replicatum]|nr:P-loop containing nucleoside triphosphate hydrolase protein [Cladochytrium replicatum]